jgi:mannosyl-oligosaccharide alpha-1,2-mannosidase
MARIIKQTVMTEVQSSSCALGASMALGSRVFGREQDWHAATRLVEGCIWLCKEWDHGTMPLISTLIACPSTDGCPWDEEAWRKEVVRAAQGDLAIKTEVSHGPVDALIEAERLPKGLVPITRGRYQLEYEAIEGVFVLYRMTGRPDLLETAWDMFAAINRTWGPAVDPPKEYDATHMIPQAADLLNPSWLGPTLRYFYLVFSDPGLASLDDFVFNQQAHPIRRVGR